MRALPVEKEQIERAKKENLYIVQVCFNGRYCKDENGKYKGSSAMTGTFSEKKVKQLESYFWKWYKGATADAIR